MNYDYDDFRFQMEEFINCLEWEIYSTEKPKSRDTIRYIILNGDGENPIGYHDKPKEYTDRGEALRTLKKYARITERGEDGKTHYYREYTSCTGDECVKKREELRLVEIDKGYHPEHSKRITETMKRCLTRIREAGICARNITRLMNGDCDEDGFLKDLSEDLKKLKERPVVDTKYYEEMEDHD